MRRHGRLFERVTAFDNLLLAARKAQKRKRHRSDVARFNFRLESELLTLQRELQSGTWQPGGHRQFEVHEPKPRLISAAPYRDRVVHHALCNVIEPLFEPGFVHDSYACRVGKGTHRALDRCSTFASRHRYVLKADVRRYFASIDHQLLLEKVARKIKDAEVIRMIEKILAVAADETTPLVYFPGDDLLTPLERAHGLPIGNLTSQFFANLYLNDMDHWIKRELKCRSYVRYCDDFLLFANDKAWLHDTHAALDGYLLALRLKLHPRKTGVLPTREGVAFVGFRIYPGRRRLARENVHRFRRRLRQLQRDYAAGGLSRAELDVRIKSWIAHAAHGDTWHLRQAILGATIFTPPPVTETVGDA